MNARLRATGHVAVWFAGLGVVVAIAIVELAGLR